MMSRLMSRAAALMLLLVAVPAAATRMVSETDGEYRKRLDNEASAEQARKDDAERERERERERQRRNLLKAPPLPTERNGLLGNWRLVAGERSNVVEPGQGSSRERAARELINAFSIPRLKEIGCAASYRGDLSFTPSTYAYSVRGSAGSAGGPIAYRATLIGDKPAIAAIPGDSRQNMMVFAPTSPDRLAAEDGCALVRVGSPAANAAANAPGNARTAAASPSAQPAAGALPQVAAVAPSPPPTLSRPSPEVCRNTLIDQLGKVGVNQVRAMSDVRFKEAAIEGKVPNTNILRIDLRGSACDDPRVKASIYDFDANGMLQSVTYVWERPPGPTPAPIFSERVTQLSRFHSLPPPQAPGQLQADISLGRLVLQDMPERNLLLEAYKTKK